MKKILTILFLLFGLVCLKSQSLLVDGCEWYYHQTEFWVGGFDTNYCYIDGDTIINQKNCKKYFRTAETCDARPIQEYLTEEDGKLYYYESSIDSFKMLYDYTAEVGDTITVEYWDNFWPLDSVFHIRIDSIQNFQYDSLLLKKFYVTYDRFDDNTIEFSEFGNTKGQYIEGIGGLVNFFYFRENGGCDWKYNNELRCYNNPNLGLIKFVEIACDSVFISSNSEVMKNEKIKIFPNPVSENIFIFSEININKSTLLIYNLDGKIIFEERVDILRNQTQEFNLRSIASSTYLVLIKNEKGEIIYRNKIVKK